LLLTGLTQKSALGEVLSLLQVGEILAQGKTFVLQPPKAFPDFPRQSCGTQGTPLDQAGQRKAHTPEHKRRGRDQDELSKIAEIHEELLARAGSHREPQERE
jgi:hypothetical protein